MHSPPSANAGVEAGKWLVSRDLRMQLLPAGVGEASGLSVRTCRLSSRGPGTIGSVSVVVCVPALSFSLWTMCVFGRNQSRVSTSAVSVASGGKYQEGDCLRAELVVGGWGIVGWVLLLW